MVMVTILTASKSYRHHLAEQRRVYATKHFTNPPTFRPGTLEKRTRRCTKNKSAYGPISAQRGRALLFHAML